MILQPATAIKSHRTDLTQDLDAGFDDHDLEDFDGVNEVLTSDDDEPDQYDTAATEDDLLGELLNPTAAEAGEQKKLKGVIDLDDLLAESLEEASASARIKSDRKSLKDTRVSVKEREAMEARIRAWELAREWKPAAAVQFFNTQLCSDCGSENSTYAGLFQRQVHRNSKVMRWVLDVNGSGNNDGLPREHKESLTEVPVCRDCVTEQGFGTEG